MTLRVVAKHADVWNFGGGTPEEASRKSHILDEHCAAIGRDPGTIVRSTQFYMKSPDEVGTLRERIEAYQAVGFSHVVVGVPTDYHAGLVQEIAKQIESLVK